MDYTTHLDRFAAAIQGTDFQSIKDASQIPPAFRLAQDGGLTSHYTPFEYINATAKVVLVGITPGFTQWKNAMGAAQAELAMGSKADKVLQTAKRTGAFSGAMRPNLVGLLDRIGVHTCLGLESCDSLFSHHAHWVQSTSILCHAIHVAGENYSGAPNMIRQPLLQQQLLEHFAPEARALPDAVYIPLGPKVSEGLDWLARQGVIASDRILHGLPHPSGANAERIAYFLGRKPAGQLSVKTNAGKLDALRESLTAQVLALRPQLQY